MPSVLMRQRRAPAPARVRRTAPRAAGDPFREVASIPGAVPLDAWAGWDGEGWGPAGSLFVTTGRRNGGQKSQVYRLDTPEGQWVEDGVPSGAEVLNKLRNGRFRGDTRDHLVAFFETPPPGQRFIVARLADSGWVFMGVPASSKSYGDPVGGRGLAFERGGPVNGAVFTGASYNWRDDRPGRVFAQQANGSWTQHRELRPSLLWELEFDDQGRLWEFWNDFDQASAITRVYVNGAQKPDPPGGDMSCATWFPVTGHMYIIGHLSSGGDGAVPEDARKQIHRSQNGDGWERVHTFSEANQGDHVLYVPRGAGELWATAHDPFRVAYSTDGTNWTQESTIPAFGTGRDTNHLTAVAYWKGAIWVMARDAGAGLTRVYTDWTGEDGGGNGGGNGDGNGGNGAVVVIGPSVFPSLVVPPRPPELPTMPVPPVQPTTKASEVFPRGEQPPMQKWVEQSDRQVAEKSLQLDAFLSKWIEDFIRVMKDAWTRLATAFGALESRLRVLETRIADTYTWGAKGRPTANEPIALPLRVVRDETLVEMTIAADHEDSRGGITIDLTRNGDTILSGRLGGDDLAVFAAEEGTTLRKNDILAAIARDVDDTTAGIVVQARCR